MTLFEAAVRARLLLTDAGLLPESAALDADLLARHTLGWDHATWLTRRGETAAPRFIAAYEQVIARRARREPVAYIRGVQEFWGREFVVTPAVLIPRPETELLIELANGYLRGQPGARVADVGTGSGCIAVTLALEHPQSNVFAIDISGDALAVARENARRLGAHDVQFVHGSLLAHLPHPVDVIVANPPYVAERDAPGLSPEVREFEPSVALYGGADGWREIRALLRETADALSPRGVLLMELGFGQSEDLDAEMRAVPQLRLDRISADLQGIPRVAHIRRHHVRHD